VGFDGATRFLGIDDQGREILSFIQGEVQPDDPREPASEARLISAARLIQSFHAATRGSDLVGPDEVVCHGELGPHNTVFRGDEAVGLIDWDEPPSSRVTRCSTSATPCGSSSPSERTAARWSARRDGSG
jgi:hypothetical protein